MKINDNGSKTYDQDDFARMSPAQRNEVLLKATKIEGTAVVLGPDGKPKYDRPELAGSYAEDKAP